MLFIYVSFFLPFLFVIHYIQYILPNINQVHIIYSCSPDVEKYFVLFIAFVSSVPTLLNPPCFLLHL